MINRCIFILVFLISFFADAQEVVLSSCNEIKNSSSRNQCLKASLENLLIKEVFRNLDVVSLKQEEPVNLSVGINVSKTGVFALSSISTPNFGLAKSIHNVLKSLKPLEPYKDEKRKVVSSNFEFDFTFILKNDNSISVLDKDEQTVYTKTFKSEEPKMVLHKGEENKDYKSDKNSESENQLKEKEDIAFAVIEEVPVYPGCEGLNGNEERKNCMSEYISAMVKNNFNIDLAGNLGLNGRQRISVQFKINTQGFITDVVARAPHPALEEEAIRVINTLPRVTPGTQKGKKVNVLYSLPIIFQVENDNTKKK